MFRKAVTIRSLIKEKSIKVVTVFHNFSLSTSFFDREFTTRFLERKKFPGPAVLKNLLYFALFSIVSNVIQSYNLSILYQNHLHNLSKTLYNQNFFKIPAKLRYSLHIFTFYSHLIITFSKYSL